MKKTFIETTSFTKRVASFLDDETFAVLQLELMVDPQKGKVMPGCGGLRKVRIGIPGRGKGKRGGARVIYLDVPEANWILLLDIYGKDEKDDLTASQKKLLRELAQAFKREAASRARREETK
jgi:hypothetical protein